MNDEQLYDAIFHLVKIGQLVLPYNSLPGSKPGGEVKGIGKNEASWLAYTWNPPQFLSHLPQNAAVDLNASDKPSYADLVIASGQRELIDLRESTTYVAKEEAQRRIVLAYGATSFDNEIMLRLRGDATTQQNTERDRLRAVYNSLKTTIKTGSLSQLRVLDLQSDSVWAGN